MAESKSKEEEPATEPEVENKATADFAGQYEYDENFVVTTDDRAGRSVVEIKPVGWVGPGFEVAGSKVKGLAKLLGKLKNLPE